MLLKVVLKLTTLPVIPIIMPNNLVLILIIHHLTLWNKTSDSHVPGNSAPTYLQVEEEQIREALETLEDCLGIRRVLESLPTVNLHANLQHLVLLQCAIICVLQIVEATALAVLQVFFDQQAEEEETLEQMREAMDNVVDAGHGVDNGKHFDFDSNLNS